VGTEKPWNTNYTNHINSGKGKEYKIKISDLSDYVLSGDLYSGLTPEDGGSTVG